MSAMFRAIASRTLRAVQSAADLISAAVEAIAEARIHRALMESQLYRGRYRHRSKIDDDLPAVF